MDYPRKRFIELVERYVYHRRVKEIQENVQKMREESNINERVLLAMKDAEERMIRVSYPLLTTHIHNVNNDIYFFSILSLLTLLSLLTSVAAYGKSYCNPWLWNYVQYTDTFLERKSHFGWGAWFHFSNGWLSILPLSVHSRQTETKNT